MEKLFKDKILICVDCGEEFVFTISAQEYFAQRGFTEDPKRCKSCYMLLKRNKRRLPAEVSESEKPEVELAEDALAYPDIDTTNGNSGNRNNLK